jgi:hypothetical protein
LGLLSLCFKFPVYANWGSLGSNVVQLEISSFQRRRNFLDSGTMASSGSAIVCVAFKALQNNGEELAFSKAVSILVCPLDIPAAGYQFQGR